MDKLVIKLNTNSLDQFAIMLNTKIGYIPHLYSHPLSGDNIKTFNTFEDAQRESEKISSKHYQSFLKEKNQVIVFVLHSDKYQQHFEILEKSLFKWTPIMSFNPISGDRTLMFDTWNKAQEYLHPKSHLSTSLPRKSKLKI
jgi:hypothetical protein